MHETSNHFVAGVQSRAAGSVSETAIRTTIRALGGQLTHTPSAVAQALGDDFAPEVDAGRKQPVLTPTDLVTLVAQRTQVRPGVALEVVESIVAELAARVGPVVRDELRRVLVPAWAAMIVDPRPRSLDMHAPVAPRQAAAGRTLAVAEPGSDTLAAGRPGSSHPVSDGE
jgi:hypothetical protein